MSEAFTDLLHDAEIEAGREDGDYLLSDLAYHEAVIALWKWAHDRDHAARSWEAAYRGVARPGGRATDA